MELDDVCHDPVQTAPRIHEQIGMIPLEHVPVDEIAIGLDITRIRRDPLANFEGALVTNINRTHGEIVVNARVGLNRQRYTLTHELYHFLNHYHQTTTDDGFICSHADMSMTEKLQNSRHQQQEIEANMFAIELLAPHYRLKPYLNKPPCLTHVKTLASQLCVSKEAIARRYVQMHSKDIAVIFSNKAKVRYTVPSTRYCALNLRTG